MGFVSKREGSSICITRKSSIQLGPPVTAEKTLTRVLWIIYCLSVWVNVGDIRDYRYEARTWNLHQKRCYFSSEEKETFSYVTRFNFPAL